MSDIRILLHLFMERRDQGVINTILEVSDLTKRYGSLVAVDRISFSVKEREIFGILGPNGAGKTTTVEMIEGLRKPDGGSINLLGKNALLERQSIKELIGVQLQSTTLHDRLKVGEAISLFGGYYRKSLDSVELLSRFSLKEKENTYVDKLSGGQKQRLALALALVNDPQILFLDEPTTGLDPQARRNLWEIISELRENGKTIILTTHYMEEAQELCDRVAIMDHGKIIALDSPDALIAKTGLESTVEIGSPKKDFCEAVEKANLPVRISQTPEKLVLHTSEPSLVLKEVTNIGAQLDLTLNDLSVHKATLEDVFLALTGRQLRE